MSVEISWIDNSCSPEAPSKTLEWNSGREFGLKKELDANWEYVNDVGRAAWRDGACPEMGMELGMVWRNQEKLRRLILEKKLDQKDPRVDPGGVWDLVPGNKGQDERKRPQAVPGKV